MYTYRYVLSNRYTYIFLTSFLPQVEKIWAKGLQQWKQRKRHARNSCKMCWKQGRSRLSTSVSSCPWWKCSLMNQPLHSALLLLCNSRNVEGKGWHRSLVEVCLLPRDRCCSSTYLCDSPSSQKCLFLRCKSRRWRRRRRSS